jgi:uridine phosphorylase
LSGYSEVERCEKDGGEMEQTLQAHIQLSANLDVKYALLPGDPARVERAKLLLEDAVDLAFNREYKSVLGTYQGMRVLVISSGIGGPSTAIAIEELAKIGIEGIIRIGSCGSLHPAVHLGDVIIATAAVRDDGASKAYVDSTYPAVADLDLLIHLRTIAETERIPHRLGIVRSHDSFYTAREAQLTAYWSGNGIIGSDMETATLFVVGALRGLKTASLLNVVVGPNEGMEEGVRQFVSGESATKRGEQNQIKLALSAFHAWHQAKGGK